MLEQLLNLAQNQIGEALKGHGDVPADTHEEVVSTAGQSIVSTIMNQASSGDMGGIMEMLSGSESQAGSPAVNSVAENVISSLMSKHNLSQGAAQNIAQMAIPIVMNMLNGKVSQAQQTGGMDIAGIIGSLTGGQNQQGGAGGLLGGLISNFMGGQKEETQNGNPPSAITDLLSNLLK